MIVAINFADKKFSKSQKYNTKTAYKYGADKVIEYKPEDLTQDFKDKMKEVIKYQRGIGYWCWKTFIILDALKQVNDGDYVIYADSGSAYVNKIEFLIGAMNNTNVDVMVFEINQLERCWTKRDAFILTECDFPEFVNSPQRCGTYIVLRKTNNSIQFVKEWLEKMSDPRMVTDIENQLGEGNYLDFRDHRHDQSVLSLLSKKWGIPAFRDPSQYGLKKNYVNGKTVESNFFSDDVIERSTYPQVLESHRRADLSHWYQLNYRCWYKWFDPERNVFFRIIKRIKNVFVL